VQAWYGWLRSIMRRWFIRERLKPEAQRTN